jgi:hypothetical protein
MPLPQGFPVGGVQIAAGSTKDFTVSIVPASIGSQVHVGPIAPLDASWAGLIWTAFVSAVNTVTIRVANVTASPITPVAQNFSARVFYDPSL